MHSDCQKEDWKKGKPRPHRLFCGKPLEPTIFQETSGDQLPIPSTSATSTPFHLPHVAEADDRAQKTEQQTILDGTADEEATRFGETIQLHNPSHVDTLAPPVRTYLSLRMIFTLVLVLGAIAAYSLR